MRLRNVKNASEIVKNHPSTITKLTKETFENNNQTHIEIGMGKGDFIINMAKTYPNINFVGIDAYESILVKALFKIDEDLPNLKIMCANAKDLNELINIKIEGLYLNFSDPWPKKRHEKRRLTHKSYLNIYEKLFKSEVTIYQKTDNKNLFAYSIKTLNNEGYTFKNISLDLHKENIPNIMTEYEKKFSSKGETINYLHATKKI